MGILQKTFGGLDKAYYFRHLVFALILGAIFIYLQYGSQARILADTNATAELKDGISTTSISMYLYIVVCVFLYPYARFVYESVVNFIMGKNVFLINIVILMIWKFFVMITLFFSAIFVAPIGLLYLWYYHNKNKTFDE